MLKRIFVSLAFAVSFCLALSVSGYAQTNLIVDGDFSSGSLSPNYTSSTTGTGSSVVINSGSPSGDGLVGNVAVLHTLQNNSTATLSQAITVTIGTHYRLAFSYSTNTPTGTMTAEVSIIDGGTTTTVSLPLVNGNGSSYVATFIPANSTTVTIQFKATNTSGTTTTKNFNIDNIEVIEMT